MLCVKATAPVRAGNSSMLFVCSPPNHARKGGQGNQQVPVFLCTRKCDFFPAMRFCECQMLCQTFSYDLAGEQEASDVSVQSRFPAQVCPQK